MTLTKHAKRISDYFEMTCYDLVIRYYEKKGYKLEAQNLQGGMFKFKCSPKGLLHNFSYFKATKIGLFKENQAVFIFHNATVQSANDDLVFTTPDIVVSSSNIPSETTDYYSTRMRLTFIPKENLVTFCEAKHLTPFPELMVNFMGTVHELNPGCTNDSIAHPISDHIAPTLMLSGSFGKATNRIKESFERRYYVNFLDNLFEDLSKLYILSSAGIERLATLGKKND